MAYTDESKAKIDEARAAYDALTDTQKALVENYGTLAAAEERYAALKAEAEKPAAPADETAGVCEYCGETHNTRTVSGFFTDMLHDLIFTLKRLVSFFTYEIIVS